MGSDDAVVIFAGDDRRGDHRLRGDRGTDLHGSLVRHAWRVPDRGSLAVRHHHHCGARRADVATGAHGARGAAGLGQAAQGHHRPILADVGRPHRAQTEEVHLAASLAILLALAGCASLVKYNYDDRKNLPADAESNLGYDALTKHFPVSTTMQQFIQVYAPGVDLRSPKSLADLEQMASAHQPGARHRRGARHHQAERRDASGGEVHLSGRRGRLEARRRIRADRDQRREPVPAQRRRASDVRRAQPDPRPGHRFHGGRALDGRRPHRHEGRPWRRGHARRARQVGQAGRQHELRRRRAGRQPRAGHRGLPLVAVHARRAERQRRVQHRSRLRGLARGTADAGRRLRRRRHRLPGGAEPGVEADHRAPSASTT